MWEIDTKKEVRNFIGHSSTISSLQVSSDGKMLLSGSWDGSIRLWDIGTGLMIRKWSVGKPVHVVRFHPDGKMILSAGADREITLWDRNNGKVIKTLTGHQAEISSLVLNMENKLLLSYSVDGVTKFWDTDNWKEFYEHLDLGEKDWMVKNPEGYFNATEKGRKYIHFVKGIKTFGVDQFFFDFYRPDLLPEIFKNRGGHEKLKSLKGVIEQAPPPQVQLAVLPKKDGVAEMFVKVTNKGAGIRELKIFHNGKRIPLAVRDWERDVQPGQSYTYKQQVEMIPGPNEFSVIASNADQVESDPKMVSLVSNQFFKNANCYLLSIGINDYKNPKMSLNYAQPDAESFAQLVDSSSQSLFKKVMIYPLYNEKATRFNILKTLDELAELVQPEDVFIFYFAGHGSMMDQIFYFIPSESTRLYDVRSLKKEGIEASLLQEKLKQIRALKQLIIMDACQSGSSIEMLATRGAVEEKALAQLSRSAGIHVMASAGSQQFATEFKELGHGLFTYVLIKALQGDADGAPKDGKITIYELKSYLDDQVPEWTRKMKGKPQYPFTFSRGQDFPVVLPE